MGLFGLKRALGLERRAREIPASWELLDDTEDASHVPAPDDPEAAPVPENPPGKDSGAFSGPSGGRP